MGGAAAVNALRDIVYIVCATCVAGINVRCMPVEAVDCMSKFRSTGSSECSVCFISDIKTALYLVKTVWKN